MPTDARLIRLFCSVDDTRGPANRHPQAKLHPSDVVTIGLVWALKGLS